LKQIVKPEKTPTPWDAEALFLKAQRYAEYMLGDIPDEQEALFAGLTLEFLARAALANVSPALLADTSNWQNLLHSLGFSPTESKFAPKSIAAAELFRRLTAVIPDFTQEIESFCVIHTGRRNAELHSGEAAFDGVPNSNWSPRFYKACEVLLASIGERLESLVGEEEADTARKLIIAAADQSAKAAKGDVGAHKKVWEAKSADDQESLAAGAKIWATRQAGHRVQCPACKSVALIQGEPVGPTHTKLEENEITEVQEYLPTHFECIACSLKVLGLSRLNAISLGDRYKSTSTYDAAEYYAPEDRYPDFEEDNNEP
jgi:hypothetical protein